MTASPPKIPLAVLSLPALISCALMGALCSPAAAAPPSPIPEVSLWGGYQHALLTRPSDPSGAPQFMSGSAFNGAGWSAGAGLSWRFLPWLGAEADLLFSQTQGEGFEEAVGAWSRHLTLSRLDLRLPLAARAGWQTDQWGADGLLGVEILFPLQAEASLREDGVALDDQLHLKAHAQTRVGLLCGGTARLPLSGRLHATLTARVSYFPGVGSTSIARFSDYESPANPGTLQIAFDWQASVLLGLLITLDSP